MTRPTVGRTKPLVTQRAPRCLPHAGYVRDARSTSYYAVMYAKPVTVSATTCSACGSSCEECEKAENLFLKELDPRTSFPTNAESKSMVHADLGDPVQSNVCEISRFEKCNAKCKRCDVMQTVQM
jgi:hypothetical protein